MLETLLNLDIETYNSFVIGWGVFAVIMAVALYFSKMLPMSNRIENKGLTILGSIDKKTGWIIMEMPILITLVLFFTLGKNPINVSAIIFGFFFIHYVNRALIYPHRIKIKGKTMAVSMMIMSMVFYIVNGYLIAYYFGSLRIYSPEWLYDPRFIIGTAIFFLGFYINVSSDNILINLRKPGETGYKIPQGGWFKYVSCPNYFGEIIEWIGFAILSWSLIGSVYAIWVALPLIAQALQAHKWYLKTFGDDYPPERKAVFPGLI